MVAATSARLADQAEQLQASISFFKLATSEPDGDDQPMALPQA